MTTTSRQAGFTLVELMVALLIGSIVVLGAGYLFFTTFQTFQKVDELSRKQEAVIFAAHTLSDNLRQGYDNYELVCELKPEDQCRCTLKDAGEGEPLVTFDRPLEETEPSDDDCAVKDPLWKEDVVEISLPLEKNSEAITFKVMKRKSFIEDNW